MCNSWIFLVADGCKGLPGHAPYDAIHVGAAAKGIRMTSDSTKLLTAMFNNKIKHVNFIARCTERVAQPIKTRRKNGRAYR